MGREWTFCKTKCAMWGVGLCLLSLSALADAAETKAEESGCLGVSAAGGGDYVACADGANASRGEGEAGNGI